MLASAVIVHPIAFCCAENSMASLRNRHVDPINSREHIARMQQFKQGVLNACLFSVARAGTVHLTRQLLSPSGSFSPYINCTDGQKRTPLWVSIQHANRSVCAALIEFRADVEFPNEFGVSPLSLAAYLVRN